MQRDYSLDHFIKACYGEAEYENIRAFMREQEAKNEKMPQEEIDRLDKAMIDAIDEFNELYGQGE